MKRFRAGSPYEIVVSVRGGHSISMTRERGGLTSDAAREAAKLARRAGVGRFLLARALEIADGLNLPVRLVARACGGRMTDEDLIRWYERRGFTRSRRTKVGQRMTRPRRSEQ